jgi:hypothetical protein
MQAAGCCRQPLVTVLGASKRSVEPRPGVPAQALSSTLAASTTSHGRSRDKYGMSSLCASLNVGVLSWW